MATNGALETSVGSAQAGDTHSLFGHRVSQCLETCSKMKNSFG